METTITTSPGAAIGNENDTLPAAWRVAEGFEQVTPSSITKTFSNHGINSSLIIQMQHLQELALAINLQGNHLIHLDLFGTRHDTQKLTLAGCPREPGWVGRGRVPRRLINIPAGGDEMALRDVEANIANAIDDLMVLLEDHQ